MFTGLIEEVGTVLLVSTNQEGRLFEISASKVLENTNIGDSIAIDGTCLSVVEIGKDRFTAQAVKETINRTTLKYFRIGTKVNLERAMLANGRLGGHFVLGHVDGAGIISSISKSGNAATFVIELPVDLMKYVIQKGSIAINGVSLTVAEKSGNRISIAVIPLTLKDTNLSPKKIGDYVNIEVDMMAKYVEQFVSPDLKNNEDFKSKIRRWGYNK